MFHSLLKYTAENMIMTMYGALPNTDDSSEFMGLPACTRTDNDDVADDAQQWEEYMDRYYPEYLEYTRRGGGDWSEKVRVAKQPLECFDASHQLDSDDGEVQEEAFFQTIQCVGNAD